MAKTRALFFSLLVSLLPSLLGCGPDDSTKGECGDGVRQGSEECDTQDFGPKTCLSMGYYGGTLACNEDCTLNPADCALYGSCGDKAIQPAVEECESNVPFEETCNSLGYSSGTLTCRGDCRFDVSNCEGAQECGDSSINPLFEQCEGHNLDGASCSSLGYYGDGLFCDDRCRYDLSVCYSNGSCGDGLVQERYEECDGSNVNGSSCMDQGYYGGALGCNTDCTFDLTNCMNGGYCGDGVLQEEHETCDGTLIGNATCAGQEEYYPGTPRCTEFCQIDYTACGRCGDGSTQGEFEQCDGVDLGTASCREMGFFGGTKSACNSDCSIIGCGDLLQIDGGEHHTCAVDDTQHAYCWGDNTYGQLGNGSAAPTGSQTPLLVPNLEGVVAISAGRNHTCALKNDGSLWCWGLNDHGQLGLGSTTDQPSPMAVTIPGQQITAVSCGHYHTCALTAGGAWCWGDNTAGRLGDGTPTERHTPTQVSLSGNYLAISAGAEHTCALLGGTAYCWGSNAQSQLGEGSLNNSYHPLALSALSGVLSISAGSTHTCATLTSGSAYCWGNGSHGKLGDGYTLDRATPVQVSGISTAQAVSVGAQHSCALLSDNTLRCWGQGSFGRLGHNATSSEETPVQPTGLEPVLHVSAASYHTCAVTTTGRGFCWGYNIKGQLGDGTGAQRLIPTEVAEPLP